MSKRWAPAGIAWALSVLLLLPAAVWAHPTVVLTGKTLLRRQLPETMLLPDGTLLRLGDVRATGSDVLLNETLVYDVDTGLLQRYAGRKLVDVLRRKSFGLSYLSMRSKKQKSFVALAKLTSALNNPDVLVVVSEAPFRSRRR